MATPRRPAEAAAVPILAVLPDTDPDFAVHAAVERGSAFADAIGKVFDAVRENHAKRSRPSLLIAAQDDGQATATLALSLAAMVAATQEVLLIDADLDRRTLQTVDADRGEIGLVDVATGRRRLADAVVHDSETHISLLPFVAAASRRDRDLSDDDIKGAFAQTKGFDLVVVVAMDFDRDPSGRFFADLVDHIVLVVDGRNADQRGIDRLVSELGFDARKIRGAVVAGANAA